MKGFDLNETGKRAREAAYVLQSLSEEKRTRHCARLPMLSNVAVKRYFGKMRRMSRQQESVELRMP